MDHLDEKNSSAENFIPENLSDGTVLPFNQVIIARVTRFSALFPILSTFCNLNILGFQPRWIFRPISIPIACYPRLSLVCHNNRARSPNILESGTYLPLSRLNFVYGLFTMHGRRRRLLSVRSHSFTRLSR